LPQHDGAARIVAHDVERVLADIDAAHGHRGIGCLRHGVLLVCGAPCQLRLLAGQEHGRTIPLRDVLSEGVFILTASSRPALAGGNNLIALDGVGGCWSAWDNKTSEEENMFNLRHLLSLAALAAALVYAAPAPAPAQTIIDEWSSVKAPPAPELKPVTVDPKTTALLVMDLIK
jgi:hypothetical protein